MKRIFVATVLATFALGSAAMAQDASCETKAVGKDGKALSGAAKTAFMDHFGAFGLTQHSVSISRLLGVALIISGVVLIKD